MEKLTEKRCQPCEGGVPALTRSEAERFLGQIPGWQIDPTGKKISRAVRLKNFLTAVEKIRQVAEIAEGEGHHPDLHLTGYRNLLIELSTHAVAGLTKNDFILASKINNLMKPAREKKGGGS